MAHTSVTLGVKLGPLEVKLGQRGQTRRCLAAGEARRGGAMRVSCSGDQNDGRARLSHAGSEPRRVVVVVGLGVAGNDAGDEFGGGRSLDKLGLVARRHGEVHGAVLRAAWATANTMACSESRQCGCGHDGDMRRRRRVR